MARFAKAPATRATLLAGATRSSRAASVGIMVPVARAMFDKMMEIKRFKAATAAVKMVLVNLYASVSYAVRVMPANTRRPAMNWIAFCKYFRPSAGVQVDISLMIDALFIVGRGVIAGRGQGALGV